jgi:YVTN family beta-propeller protein
MPRPRLHRPAVLTAVLILMAVHAAVATAATAAAAATAATAAAAATPRRAVSRPSLLVLDKDDNEMIVIDLRTQQISGRVAVGMGPHEVVTSTDGTTAFVANYGDGPNPGSTISVIDLTTLTELRRVDVSPMRRPHGLAFADGKLYFTSETSRVVARYDPVANAIDWILGTGQTTTHMVYATPDGRTLYTANIGGNSVSIIERGANPLQSTVTTIPVGRGPEGFDVSPDGKELWAAHSQDGGVSVVDLTSRKVIATIDAKTGRSNRCKFTLDGTRVLISDLTNNQVVVIDAKTRAVVQRIPTGKTPLGILMDPDGRRAFVAFSDDRAIGVLDLATMTFGAPIATGAVPDGMAILR